MCPCFSYSVSPFPPYHPTHSSVPVCLSCQYHDMGLIGSVLGNLFCGGSGYYMSPVSFVKRPPLWMELISRYRGTHMQVPEALHNRNECWIPLSFGGSLERYHLVLSVFPRPRHQLTTCGTVPHAASFFFCLGSQLRVWTNGPQVHGNGSPASARSVLRPTHDQCCGACGHSLHRPLLRRFRVPRPQEVQCDYSTVVRSTLILFRLKREN